MEPHLNAHHTSHTGRHALGQPGTFQEDDQTMGDLALIDFASASGRIR
jgi:hypothetical protein